jgi:hypothetical protein
MTIMPNAVGRVARRGEVKSSRIAHLRATELSNLQRFGSRDEDRDGAQAAH